MSVSLDIVTALDDRAVAASVRRLESELTRAGTVSGQAFNNALAAEAARSNIAADRIAKGLEDRLGTSGTTAGQHFITGLMSQLGPGAGQVTSAFERMSASASGTFSGISSTAGLAAAGIGGIAIAAVGVTAELIKLGTAWDEQHDRMIGATGKLGAELDGLQESVKQVAVSSSLSISEIGNVVGQVSQSLHLTGQDLTELSKNIADLDELRGVTLNVHELGLAFKLFGVDTKDQVSTLDELNSVSQQTGIGMNELVQAVADGGRAAKQFGFDAHETASIIGLFESAGLDGTSAINGLGFALKTLGKAGLEPKQGLADVISSIKELHDEYQRTGDESKRTQEIALATAAFGRTAFLPWLNAVDDGVISVDKLNTTVQNIGPSIDKQKKAQDDWQQSWQKIKNTISVEVEPAAKKVFEVFSDGLTGVISLVDRLADRLSHIDLSKGSSWGDILSWANPALAASNLLFTHPDSGGAHVPQPAAGDDLFGSLRPPAPPPAPGAPAAPGDDLFGSLRPPPPGPVLPGASGQVPSLKPEKAGGGAGGGPQIPYAADYGAPPAPGETPEHWRQRMGVIKAQHDVAEAQARVDDIDKDNTATQEQTVKAHNDLIDAKMRETTAEQSLNKQTGGAAGGVQVPYGPGYGAAPRPGETAQQYSSEQSYYEAQHKVAEARATLQKVEANSTHTAEDLVKARNDLTKAEVDEQQALLRLSDQAGKTSSNLGEVGAKLDQDFGISRGLPGIVENLTKFIANIATAPLFGQLNAISAASPIQGGYGLLGIMGANNIAAGLSPAGFPLAAGSGGAAAAPIGYGVPTGATGGSAGYAGDAALLANVPAGRYDASGDLTKGLGDCSSAVEDLVNIMDGRPTAGRSMSTGNEAAWLTQRGFLPTNQPMPGSFQVGLDPEHTQATLPGGTPFNWGSDAAAARGGVGGTGAWDPAFTQHFYRPVDGSAGPPVSAPTPGGGSAGVVSVFVTNMPAGGIGGPALAAPAAAPAPGVTPPLASPAAPAPSPTPFFGGSPGEGPGIAPTPGAVDASLIPGLNMVQGAGGPFTSGAWGTPQSTVPQMIPGAGGKGYLGLPQGPGVGGAAGDAAGGPTQIGGVDPLQGSGKGGIGMKEGGLLDTALGIGAMAFPGAGQLAQTGAKLTSRAIQFGSQAAGIMAQGAMETFLPMGGSKLAQSNWLTKVVGGLAGAGAALPNVAGKASIPSGNPQQGQPGDGKGGQGGDQVNHITVNNQRATEDGTGRDVAHAISQNEPPGRP